MKCCSLTLVKDMTYLHLMNRCIFWPIMRQLNTSIEAVVCSGAFVPMSKCARMLVLFLGMFLVINSQINLIFRNFYAIFPKFSAISYLVSPHAYPQLFLISDTLKRISLNSMRLKRNVLKIIRAKKKNVFKTKKSR